MTVIWLLVHILHHFSVWQMTPSWEKTKLRWSLSFPTMLRAPSTIPGSYVLIISRPFIFIFRAVVRVHGTSIKIFYISSIISGASLPTESRTGLSEPLVSQGECHNLSPNCRLLSGGLTNRHRRMYAQDVVKSLYEWWRELDSAFQTRQSGAYWSQFYLKALHIAPQPYTSHSTTIEASEHILAW